MKIINQKGSTVIHITGIKETTSIEDIPEFRKIVCDISSCKYHKNNKCKKKMLEVWSSGICMDFIKGGICETL